MAVEVSIICLVYNHECFLRKCLDGFVNQNTNFNYEIIIHDDCSTDSSKAIIEEYVAKNPNLFIPLYEEENQYSQGHEFVQSKMESIAQGKYLAYWEGDDYWCDNNKLQIQYDYMEKHPECSLCVHNTIRHDLMGLTKDTLFNNWNAEHNLSEKDVFFGWNVQTSSYFIRQKFVTRPAFALPIWCGDYTRLTLAFDQGTVVSLPRAMSVYDFNNTSGLTYLNDKISYKIKQKKEIIRADYLKKYNEYTNYRHNDIIQSRINQIYFNNKLLEVNHAYKNGDKSAFRKKIKELVEMDFYKEMKKNSSLVQKIKRYLKYSFPLNYYLWIAHDKLQ